jgi:Dullard-like phosphatase family protein
MVLFKFLKKLFCLDCGSSAEVDVSLVDFTSQNQKNATLNFDTKIHLLSSKIIKYVKIKPLTSKEVFNMTEKDIELNSDDLDSVEYTVEPLPETNIKQPTLVLDLDNTLIYASTKELQYFDHLISVNYKNKNQKVWILERPGLSEFLDLMSQHFELVLFTAGIRQYGIKVMKKIDPKMKISYFLDRRFCTFLGRNSKNQELYTKNISILGRDESKTILVDDRDYSFVFNLECRILIPSFDGDLKDDELQKLGDFLINCSQLTDMRERIDFNSIG